jgi:hypothetical protein
MNRTGDVIEINSVLRAARGQGLAHVRNPHDGRGDQLVITHQGRRAYIELTPAMAIKLAEDLLRSARAMKDEGRVP